MEEKKKKKFDISYELYDWAHSLVFAFVSFVLILTFLAGIFSVSQNSMTDTLHDGEMILISRLPYAPKSEDVVLFVKHGWGAPNPDTGLYNPLIKRIIGLPGDELYFNQATENLYVNGELKDEPYIKHGVMTHFAHESLQPTGVVIVPEGYVFVMGDNREGSHDSRNADIGFVDSRSILGPVILRISPLTSFGRI